MDDYTSPKAAAGAKPAGAGYELDHDDLLLRVKDWFLDDGPHCRKWHTVAKEDFAYRAGDQWPEEDKRILEDQRRAPLVFNRIDPVIDAVRGSEITNRQEVRYIPRQVGDGPVNEVITEAARWFRDECDAEHEESDAFADATTCGMGWTETRLDYEDDPDGKPLIDRIDPIEMFWDAAARAANLTDARRVYRVRRNVPLEECKARWPDYEDDSCYDATWAANDGDDTDPYDNPKPRYPSERESSDDDERDTVTLVQVQWYEREIYYRGSVVDPMTGMQEPVELTETEHTTMQIRAPELGRIYRGVRQVKKCYYEAFIGGEVLESGKMVAPSGRPALFFKFVPITGKLDRNLGHFYGIVRGLKGPQHFTNKLLSTVIEIMARSAKGGLLLEEGAVTDTEEFEQEWAKPGANSYVKRGAITEGRVQPKPATTVPPDLIQMMQFSIASFRDVSGVNAETMGTVDSDRPASLEYQRRQSATVILSPLFDSLRRYRRIQGRALLFLITEYLTDGRLIRIVGDEGERYVPLVSDPSVSQYDVIVDDAPSSPSQKELVWHSFTQVMPLLQHMEPPPEAIMALLDYSPVPASVVAKVKEAVMNAQKNAPPPPPDPLTLKAEEAKISMAADQQKNAADIQMDQQKASLDMQIAREKAALELQHKTALAHLDLQTKSAETQQEMALKRQENALNVQEAEERNGAMMTRSIGALADPVMRGVQELVTAQAAAQTAAMTTLRNEHVAAMAALHSEMRKPRKRTLIRGKDGRASHAIEEIIDAKTK